ncbi:MAG TPA: peptide chain release factor N(5)-glutamine methyltransferase [Gemmatimonadales bacterium]|nr:peptide chain release factor N(5)-glutamine methyltransferase [Gemmatimonadales bacterium]
MPERVAARRSIAAVLDAAARQLAQAGLAEPRREATALWAAAGTGVKPGDVWLRRDAVPPPAVAARFRAALARRARGMPFAYAVGRVGFRQVDLALDRRALIPRPETEGLVDLVLAWTRGAGAAGVGGVVADIGTGCGCIALSLAVEGAFRRIIAVERSAEAAALARENVARVCPPVPVEVHAGDLLAPLAGERLRAIVSNPPYLTMAEYAALDPAVRLWEPGAALVSGTDGLSATRALLAGARAVLECGGLLALELDARRAAETQALALELGWPQARVHQDLFGQPRFLLAVS